MSQSREPRCRAAFLFSDRLSDRFVPVFEAGRPFASHCPATPPIREQA